jgi:predicted nucleic acid-binding protein
VENDPIGETDAEHRRGYRSLTRRALTLIVDASVAVPACLSEAGFAVLPDDDLVAPPLLWFEARSALHELVWRQEIAVDDGEVARVALENAPVRSVGDARTGAEAWRIASELGWAKTYGAEYLALAERLGCRVVTLDLRLRRRADALGLVVSIDEL